MSAMENDEVLFTLGFYKWIHLYHMIDPNDYRIFNYHFHRLAAVLLIVTVQFFLLFGTIGIFLEMEDSVGIIDNTMKLGIFMCNVISVLRMSIIITNADKIWSLLDVMRVQFLKSQHCRKHRRILEKFKNKFSSYSKYLIIIYFTTVVLWMLYPLTVNIDIEKNRNGNVRYESILNLPYPVNINTFNQYFWIFYVIEIIILLYFTIALVIDTFIISLCLVITVQYETLHKAFASIGNENESDIKGKLNYLKNKAFHC